MSMTIQNLPQNTWAKYKTFYLIRLDKDLLVVDLQANILSALESKVRLPFDLTDLQFLNLSSDAPLLLPLELYLDNLFEGRQYPYENPIDSTLNSKECVIKPVSIRYSYRIVDGISYTLVSFNSRTNRIECVIPDLLQYRHDFPDPIKASYDALVPNVVIENDTTQETVDSVSEYIDLNPLLPEVKTSEEALDILVRLGITEGMRYKNSYNRNFYKIKENFKENCKIGKFTLDPGPCRGYFLWEYKIGFLLQIHKDDYPKLNFSNLQPQENEEKKPEISTKGFNLNMSPKEFLRLSKEDKLVFLELKYPPGTIILHDTGMYHFTTSTGKIAAYDDNNYGRHSDCGFLFYEGQFKKTTNSPEYKAFLEKKEYSAEEFLKLPVEIQLKYLEVKYPPGTSVNSGRYTFTTGSSPIKYYAENCFGRAGDVDYLFNGSTFAEKDLSLVTEDIVKAIPLHPTHQPLMRTDFVREHPMLPEECFNPPAKESKKEDDILMSVYYVPKI